ncbi:MAG: aromatic ring-hydroxylating oxygenase subunit alpha [Alphaproteobacteria bacterium]
MAANVLGEAFPSDQFAGVMRPIGEAFTPPPWYYTSQSWFDAEVEHIFARVWNCIGRVERIPAPGDYFTIELAGHPVLVVHGADSVIRAFVNSCPDRPARLRDGAGHADTMPCPHCGRTFALDGTGADGGRGLTALRCASAHGFLFVNLDSESGTLAEYLGDFDTVFAPYDLANMVCMRRTEFECACNWKASAEVFMEYYHTHMVHPLSLGTVERLANPPEDVRGNFVTMFSDHSGTRALIAGRGHAPFPPIATLTGRAKAGTRFSLIYPGFALGCTIDAMWFIESYPVSPGRTKYAIGGCFPRKTTARGDYDALAPGYFERWETAAREDNDALERQHKGLLSPYALPGRIQPALESIVPILGRWVAERVLSNP